MALGDSLEAGEEMEVAAGAGVAAGEGVAGWGEGGGSLIATGPLACFSLSCCSAGGSRQDMRRASLFSRLVLLCSYSQIIFLPLSGWEKTN